MNARASLFVNARQSAAAARLAACAGACLMLGACVGNPFEDAKVDPRSPIAKDVPKIVRADAAYPTFAAVPPVPKDVRPHRQYGRAAGEVEQAATDLERATAENTWALPANTEAYAAEARAAVGPDIGPSTAAQTEAFAAALRKRATPPPPTKR